LPRKSLESDRRRRIELASAVLRRFRIVDREELGQLILSGKPLTEASIASVLNRTVSLPAGIPPEFIAKSILTALRENTSAAGDDCPDPKHLASIKPGKQDAKKYERYVEQALTAIFKYQLSKPKAQQPLHSGLKVIDITFNNAAENGFFTELHRKFGIPCPYVTFELKNYGDDVGNPEFDQLAGRLSDQRGRFGVLVCRSVANRRSAIERANRQLADNQNVIVLLDDTDLMALINYRLEGDEEAINNLMADKLRELHFS
jgi:hypothetical protein